jgi:hypothetical protein
LCHLEGKYVISFNVFTENEMEKKCERDGKGIEEGKKRNEGRK